MKILVCGGRTFSNLEYVETYLRALHRGSEMILIHGAARGADSIAAEVATKLGWQVIPFPADWNRHGLRAGPIRNQQMIEEGKPDLVIAFPGGKGTADMIRRARKAGLRVVQPMLGESVQQALELPCAHGRSGGWGCPHCMEASTR